MARGKSLHDIMDAREIARKRGLAPAQGPMGAVGPTAPMGPVAPMGLRAPTAAAALGSTAGCSAGEDLWSRIFGLKDKLFKKLRYFLVAVSIVLVALLVHAYEPFRVKAAVVIGTTGASDAVRALSVAVPMAVAAGVGLAWVS
jgi:hypothetical protein